MLGTNAHCYRVLKNSSSCAFLFLLGDCFSEATRGLTRSSPACQACTKLPLVLSSVLLVFLPHISATTHLIQVLTSLIEIPSRSLNDLTSVSFPSLALTQNSFFTWVCTFCAGSCLGSDSEGSFQSDSLPFPRLRSQDPQALGSGASGSTNTPAWYSPTSCLKCLKNT